MAKSDTAQSRSSLANRAEQRRLQREKDQRRQLSLVGVVVVLIVIVFGVLIYILTRQQTTGSVDLGKLPYAQMRQELTPDGAPIIGDPATNIVVMEFADFSCPHCLDYHPTITQLINDYVSRGKIRLIYEPQTFVGGDYSVVAAEAALCANKQYVPEKKAGFWDVQDILYNIQATQSRLGFTLKIITAQTDSLGLDSQQIVNCVASGEMQPVLTKSYALFNKVGATGTPTMMISTDGGETFNYFKDANGQPITGGPSYDTVTATIEADLAKTSS